MRSRSLESMHATTFSSSVKSAVSMITLTMHRLSTDLYHRADVLIDEVVITALQCTDGDDHVNARAIAHRATRLKDLVLLRGGPQRKTDDCADLGAR